MSFTHLVEYEAKLYDELLEEDGLVITAKGLGLDRILLKSMTDFCNAQSLVVVLNATFEEQEFFIDELSALGVTHLPKIVTAEVSSNEREKMYLGGGVFFITSRILVVDMLTKRIPIDFITGILVHRAHKIGESSQEAFILRMFREGNNAGFIKGFSDSPTLFMLGYSRVERVMKQLFVRKLYLRPRFHADVVACLEQHKPDVIELSVEPTPAMQGIQLSILDLIEACLRELKRCTPSLDPEEVTSENSLTKNFDKMLKTQLDPHWNQLSNKTKQLVSDIKILRVLLSYLTQYDCVTFYNFLLSLRANEVIDQRSIWMMMDASNSLFVNAKARIFGNEKLNKKTKQNYTDGSIEISPKWEAVQDILKEIEEKNKSSNDAGHILLCAYDERTCHQLKQVLCEGSQTVLQGIFEKSAIATTKSTESSKKRKHNDDASSSKTKSHEHTDEVEDLNFTILQNSMLVVHPLTGCTDPYSLLRKLHELQPKYVILYDAQMEFVRQLEVFKASRPEQPLNVYFLFYSGSVEEQRYLTTLRKEKDAFELLIRQKAEMVIPEERQGRTEIARGFIRGENNSNDTLVNTRKSGGQVLTKRNHLVIVDMREFRSDLPSLIHKRGIDIEPVTLEVGDYILSPEICVERKSISDLIGSLNNGRLYTQCVAMIRFYSRPILLIEFDETKTSFSLQSKTSLRNEVSLQNISSKLTLLTLHFPKLRIIWSQSPHLSAEIFEELKKNTDEPNTQVAMAIGVDTQDVTSDTLFNMTPLDMVQKLPGIDSRNYRKVMTKFSTLKDLINQGEDDINEVLEHSSNSKSLHEFVAKEQDVSVAEDRKKKKK